MKTKIFSSALSAAFLLSMVLACTKEIDNPVEIIPNEETITATISDLTTKVSFIPGYDSVFGKPESMELAWADGDKLRIYNHSNRSQYSDFTLDADCIGQKAGRFTGTLVAASSYDVEIINGSFDYSSQSQPSDGVTTNLKYLASVSGVESVKSVVFSDFSSILAVTAQMPSSAVAAKIKSVDIKASENIFNGGNTLSISFSTAGDAGGDGILHFFATLPKGDQKIPAGTSLLVKFNAPGQAHDVYTRYIEFPTAKTFTSNKVNALNISTANSASFANTSTTDIGSEDNPYIIGDKYQMQAMKGFMVEKAVTCFRLVDDVDLKNVSWEPLNVSSDPPMGIDFDGGGHTISNLTVGDASNYPSFVGFLWGVVRNVVFDGANITTGNTKEQSGGVVAGYIGASSYQGDCSAVTIRNSSVTSGGGTAYVAGLGARVGKAAEFRNCHVINTTVTTASSGSCVGGMISYIASNAALVISDCSAEDITVTAGGHYAGGLVAQIISNNPVVISRCHTTGVVTRSSSGRHFGGLVGSIQSADVQVVNCYSTCSVTGYQFNGGLIGSFYENGCGIVDHCFASGNITDVGNSGDGGLIGTVHTPGVTVSNSIAWNDSVLPKKYGEGNYSTGAVVGRSHPNTNFENNYRKPGMNLTAYWTPSAEFDHPNSKLDGDVYYIWRIGTDLVEANGGYTTATSFSSPNGVWAYHGKHLSSGTKVTPDDQYGWTSSPAIQDVPSPSQEDPEASDYTGNNVWGLGTTVEIRPGVEWTTFNGTWQGQVRNINIIRTVLSEQNRLGVFFDYSTEGRKFLDEKCVYKNAVAGTNGSMACCQFVRVNDVIKHAATKTSPWIANCAVTIDGDEVNIVKVEDNYDAAMLPNHNVSCAGPLLVWKGNLLTAPQEWLDADTDSWLTDTNPRTAIGLSKDGKTVIQVTVDGRWSSSKAVGMSTDLLARLMKELGCYKAMNLDGGGGAQMWVYGKGDVNNIVNHPHNEWPYYGCGSGTYYWIKDNEVARRAAGSAIYVY